MNIFLECIIKQFTSLKNKYFLSKADNPAKKEANKRTENGIKQESCIKIQSKES